MDNIFRDVKEKSVLNYIDDFLTFSKTFLEHLNHLHEVCARLRDAGLKISVAKCKFGYEEVRFLGNVVSADGAKPSEDRVQAVHDMAEPTTVRQLRSFLGLANWYRKFIRNFALGQPGGTNHAPSRTGNTARPSQKRPSIVWLNP